MLFRRALLAGALALVASAALAINNPLLLGVGGPPSASLTTLTFVASGVGTSPTITIPGTPTAGDLCVIVQYSIAGTPAIVTPSGFTELITSNTGIATNRASMWAKKLVGGETTVTGTDGTADRWIAMTFHPNSAIGAFAANDIETAMSTVAPGQRTIQATGAATKPVLLIGQMGAASGDVIDPRTISPAMSEIAGGATNHYGHYFIYNSADTLADHTYDMADEGIQNMLQTLYITVTP